MLSNSINYTELPKASFTRRGTVMPDSNDFNIRDGLLEADEALYCNEGLLSDPTITDATGVAVKVTSVDVLMHSDSTWGGKLYHKTVPTNTALALTDDSINYIYVDWNDGNPIYAATTDRDTINNSNAIPVSRVYMSSGSIEYQLDYDYVAKGATIRNFDRVMRIRGVYGIERESGLAITETATRVINIAAGYAWFGVSRKTLAAVAQGGSGVVSELWYHSGGNWTSGVITAYNNTQYDNGTALATLTANRYAVNWVFRNITTSEIDVVLGTGDYTLAQAEASQLPTIPTAIANFYVLCGRIIVQKSSDTAYAIENVSTYSLRASVTTNHADLSGLTTGDDHTQYRLESADHTHASTGAQAGQLDHGNANTAASLLDDDHTIYLLADGTREITGSTHFSNNKSLGWDNAAGIIQEVILLNDYDSTIVETPYDIVINSNSATRIKDTIRVAASLDDTIAYWNSETSTWILSPTDTAGYVGRQAATVMKLGTGMRFLNVLIPKGSLINSAYITVTAKASQTTTTVNSYITGELTGTPAAFSDIANYQARRGTACGGGDDTQRTVTQVAWDNIESFTAESTYNSPEIKTVIQEIATTTAIKDLVLFWDDHDARGDNTNSDSRQIYSYNGSTSKAPLLYVSFTPPPITLQVADVDILKVLATNIECKKHLQLLSTDTDGTVTGQIWYDTSENKLKFKTASGVETITSS